MLIAANSQEGPSTKSSETYSSAPDMNRVVPAEQPPNESRLWRRCRPTGSTRKTRRRPLRQTCHTSFLLWYILHVYGPEGWQPGPASSRVRGPRRPKGREGAPQAAPLALPALGVSRIATSWGRDVPRARGTRGTRRYDGHRSDRRGRARRNVDEPLESREETCDRLRRFLEALVEWSERVGTPAAGYEMGR